MTRTGRAWFAPKRYGYGAVPVTWEGWLATAVFALAVAADVSLLHRPVRWVGLGFLIALFAALAWARCGDAFRWRWGK